MSVLRIFGRGLHQAMNRNLAAPDSMDLRAGRHTGTMAGSNQYAALGWRAEQAGQLSQALAIYDLLAARPAAPRWVEQRRAAVALALGRNATAIAACEKLRAANPRDMVTTLALSQLLLNAGEDRAATGVLEHAAEQLANLEGVGAMEFSEAMLDCLEGPVGDAAEPESSGVYRVQMLSRRGLSYLQRGRYVRATELFQDAMNLVDTLLVCHGQWLLAQARVERGALPEHLVESVISLSQLSDLLLQYMARTKLAGNLAEALRQRHLRQDLASWATGCHEVQCLLRTERARLGALVVEHRQNAELHYRIGLCHRATGELEAAAASFTHVLALAPHHAQSGVRLAATLLQLHRPTEVLRVLERTFTLDPAAARQYHALAVASTDAAKFDRAVMALARDLGVGYGAPDVKANIAFALGMLGVHDADKEQWKEYAAESGACAS